MPRPELSLVIPIYNEEEVLPQLDVRLKELLGRLGISTEVVFVNDGSKDRSIELLRRMASHELRYRVIGFSRNFGHQRAITAGMDKSRGRAVVVMDADLQDPPEVILDMVAKWQAGFDVVYGRRRSRSGESWFKLVTAKMFYRLFASMIPIEVPLDTGDFRLMSRRVVQTMRNLRETHRFVRGLVAWVGFRQTAVEYDRGPRAAGETKYPLRKMISFAIDGIASFSVQPLRMSAYVGVLVGFASVVCAIAAIVSNYAGLTIPGWTTTVVLLSFLFSVQFFMIGVLGEYVGRIYEQVKRRPLYIVSERINFKPLRSEKLITQDIEELKTPVVSHVAPMPTSGIPPAPPRVPSFEDPPLPTTRSKAPPIPAHQPLSQPPARQSPSQKPPSHGPPPPSNDSPLSRRPSRASIPDGLTPAAPKLSSSVANIHVALPVRPTATATATATTQSVPPAARFPSVQPPRMTPSTPPVKVTPSAPPVAVAKAPSTSQMKAAPVSVPPMKAATPSSPPMKAASVAPGAPPRPSSSVMKAAAPVSGRTSPSSSSMKAANLSVTPSTPPAAPKSVAPRPPAWDPATAEAIASSDEKATNEKAIGDKSDKSDKKD